MNPLFEAGLNFQHFFESKKWPFCFIGGLAVIRWGEVRMTRDIDLNLFTGFGNEEKFISGLLESFSSRITDPRDFAVQNRVLLLHAKNGVPVDISLGGLQFEQSMIQQATHFTFYPLCSLITCSAEDLIVLKAFADRQQDWLDIEGIIVRQETKLDGNYVFAQLKPLCELKENALIVPRLQKIFASAKKI